MIASSGMREMMRKEVLRVLDSVIGSLSLLVLGWNRKESLGMEFEGVMGCDCLLADSAKFNVHECS